ncbi:Gfo/Idh/MocA family protein [Paenibacillus eucommiae]|nr:Gfo/Idh/MocA family oxidoreductase [Paenibacillus eucommiae]
MMTRQLKLGMIGLDTSHVSAFAALLNDAANPYHVPGGTIQVVYPGIASEDFEISYGRVRTFTDEMVNKYNARLVDSEQAVAEECDAILLLSVDGRVHLEQFRKIAAFGKPVFIDKPLAVSTEQAREIMELVKRYQVPFMSCSSLRYGEALTEQLQRTENGSIRGADCFGPMMLQPTQPGLYWYGIHAVEMLYRVMGQGCQSVTATKNEDYDVIVGVWKDGRIGTIRGNRVGNYNYGVLIHWEKEVGFADINAHPKPMYASMLEHIMHLFQSGESNIDLDETLEIMHFIECANESRITGKTVRLCL